MNNKNQKENIPQEGVFENMLKRSAPQLKADRARVVSTNVEKNYRRKLEDLLDNIDQFSSDLINLLDLSSDNTQMIINPASINAEEVIKKREKLIEDRRRDFNKYFSLYYDYRYLFGNAITTLLDPYNVLKKHNMVMSPLQSSPMETVE